MGAKHESYPNWRPSLDEYNAGIHQVGTLDGRLSYWRPADEPGRWYVAGNAKNLAELEVPFSAWKLLVDNPEGELRARQRLDDLAKVQSLIKDATSGPSTKGEEKNGYFLREHAGGLATVHASDGQRMHASPLPVSVAEGILAELAGTAEQEDEDA